MQERKYLAHYLDAAFDTSYANPSYYRIGKNLEEYNDELNPDVEVSKNILGEQSVRHSGYEVQGDAEPYYYDYDDELGEKLMSIANSRATGDKCKTTAVDVLLKPDENDEEAEPSVVWAYREDVYVVPNSVGGDTSGIQIPFSVYRAGNRVKGTFDLSTKKFTEISTTSVQPTSAKATSK